MASRIAKLLAVAALVSSTCTSAARPGIPDAPNPAGPLSFSSPIECRAPDTTSISGSIDSPPVGTELAGNHSALIPNGDFTQGLAGWVISDPETVRLDDNVEDQRQTLRVLAEPTTKLRHINSPRFAVTPGASYKLTIGARISSGATQLGAFSIVFFASRASRDRLRLDLPSGPPRYVEYTSTGTVPPGVGQAMLQLLYDTHEGPLDLTLYEVRYAETGSVEVVGWAVDRSTAADPGGAGIDEVSLYLDGPPGAGTPLGTATYGDRREDVASGCGDSRFADSGWRYAWDISALAPGEHTLYVVMRSVSGLTSMSTTTIRRLPAHKDDPIGAIDTPVGGMAVADVVTISGWAIDRNSSTGTGVDRVSVYLDAQHTTETLLGEASYGDPYPGVGRHFGETRFMNSGWHFGLDTTDVAAGSHNLSVVLHSSAPGRTTTLSRELVVSDGREVTLRSPTGSSRSQPGATSALAVDGREATIWNSGGLSPQWIEVDLRSSMTITRLRLVTAQTPAGATTHRVYGRAPGAGTRLLHEFSGYTSDGEVLEYSPSTPWNDVRFIRVETVESPSWVAWREIAANVVGPTPIATVRGSVVSAETPIGGAQVDLRKGDQVVQSAFTDDRGAYSFAAIPPGVYAVRVHSPSAGYQRWAEAPLHIVEAGVALALAPLELPRR